MGSSPARARISFVPESPRLHGGFLESAARDPDAPALLLGDRIWTYGEMDRTARRWAAAIIETAGHPPGMVGVFGGRSEVSYVGILAALYSGAAFVPLSPTMPARRTRWMLSTVPLDALVVDQAAVPQLSEVLAGRRPPPILLPATAGTPAGVPEAIIRNRSDLVRCETLQDLPPGGPLAYLLFTSGSTGTPKGIPISHANVAQFLQVNRHRYAFTRNDRLTQTFEHVFDLSIFDLFMAWDAGACVCPPRPIELLSPFRFVRDQEITVWFSVPSVATLLRRQRLLQPGVLESLRWSLFCGEALSQATAETWQAAAPSSTVENLYGPTETTIACTAYRWDPERSPEECVDGLLPIGKAFEGVHTLIVDEALRPVSSGATGELCVAGPQTFSGYWRDQAASSAAFFTSVDANGDELRYYRTGDRVRTLPTGDLVFLGRLDHQIQVMGRRVEPGEIEAILRSDPSVLEAVVVPRGLEAGTADWVEAFVSGTGIDVGGILEAARARLPAYMVPRAIRVLDGLPLNRNGKVDRAALRRLLEHRDR